VILPLKFSLARKRILFATFAGGTGVLKAVLSPISKIQRIA